MLIRVFFYILTVTFCISIHEIGHYIAGRILNIRIKHIRIIPPLGGYVRFEDSPKEGEFDRDYYLTTCKPWKKIIVFLSGVATNYVCAVLIAWILFCVYNPKQQSLSLVKPAIENVHHKMFVYTKCAQDEIKDSFDEITGLQTRQKEATRLHIENDSFAKKGGYYQSARLFPKTWNTNRLMHLALMINVLFILFNIIPLPPLDGGNVLFATYELLARKKANEKLRQWVYGTGAFLLIVYLLYGIIIEIYKDVIQ